MTDTPEVPNTGETTPQNREPLSLVQMLDLSLGLRAQMEAGLSREYDTLERPYVMAGMMAATHKDPMDLRSHFFESMVDAFMGLRLGPLVEPYVKLYDDLVAHDHLDSKTKFEFGNDAYVWAIPERFAAKKGLGLNLTHLFGEDYEPEAPDPKARRTKAIVLQTQSCNFLVVMNYAYGRWQRMDVREFWPDVREELADDGYLLNLNGIKDRKDLTVLDVVKYSTLAAAYSDDFSEGDGYRRIERPSLATLLNGTLMPGDEDSGVALRYASAVSGFLFCCRDSGTAVVQSMTFHSRALGLLRDAARR